MYLHEIQKDIDNRHKVRRAGWPAGHHISKAPESSIELSKEEKEAAGLNANADVSVGQILIYAEGSDKATYGYELSHSDKVCQDWENVIDKKKK